MINWTPKNRKQLLKACITTAAATALVLWCAACSIDQTRHSVSTVIGAQLDTPGPDNTRLSFKFGIIRSYRIQLAVYQQGNIVTYTDAKDGAFFKENQVHTGFAYWTNGEAPANVEGWSLGPNEDIEVE